MLCAHPSACNSLSNPLHLTLPSPTQHSACGSFFWSKISPLGSHSNLHVCLYYHLFCFIVHIKSHTLDGVLFKCRNCVFMPLGLPHPPLYAWCRHLWNGGWIQPFWAPDLHCLHPPSGKSKRFRPKQMSSCPLGWPGSEPHFLLWPQPPGLVTPDLEDFSLASLGAGCQHGDPQHSRAPAGLGCAEWGEHIRLASCRFAASGELGMSGLNKPTWQRLFLPLGLRRGTKGEWKEALESPEPALPGGSVGVRCQ